MVLRLYCYKNYGGVVWKIKYVVFIFKGRLKFWMDKVRIDKWFWSVWIFKLRIIVIDVCKLGKIKIKGVNVKFFYLVECEELVEVCKNGFDF